ncbi:hypothetical protein [Jidongwangia harbinensis]|uniref:hypothetical protein n=1 Tax=Jidongwangia harbinensis TaxID=2878561 RepID=UPI001CD9632A|nr:hypothetical protein [Jidongwangia harbinensis]MCA2217811.1 hypothetical protein [Jidongwangia harbinensis]
MPYLLGIDIGESSVAAAVCRRVNRSPHGRAPEAADAHWGPAQPVNLGATDPAVAATLLLAPGGGLVAADSGTGPGRPGEYAAGFLSRVGDDVGVRLASRGFPAQTLVAGMVGWVAGRLWQLQGQAPEQIAVAHPTGWGPYRLGLLRTALAEAGLGEPALVSRAGAVVTAFQAADRLPPTGTVLLVFRLGATGLEVSLVALHPSGQHELVSTVECPDVSGSDVDDAADADRRALLQAGVDLAVRTVTACGIPATDLSAVLLAGDAAGHTVLSDLLAAAFGVPVLQHGDRRLTVACGAALSVRPRIRRPAAVPAVPDFPTSEAPVIGPAETVSPGPQAVLPPPRPPVRVSAASVGGR